MSAPTVQQNSQGKLDKDLKGQVIQKEKYYFAAGGYADVYRGEWTNDLGIKIPVAIKVLRAVHADPEGIVLVKKRLNRETGLWYKLNHPNVLPFLGVCSDIAASPAIISPLRNAGNVSKYMGAHPEANSLDIILGIARGMKYLHSREVVHGDLKPHNVLMDDNGVPQICDFGRSRIIGARGYTTATAISSRWTAPELTLPPGGELDGGGTSEICPPAILTKESDVFAFSMVVLEVSTGKAPFYHVLNDATVILYITSGRRPVQQMYGSPSPILWAVLEKCWNQEPGKRPDMSVVLQSILPPRV